MARLPDVRAFGERPTPEALPPVLQLSGVGAAERAEQESAISQAKVGAQFTELGDRLALAAERLQARHDALASLRTIRDFREKASNEAMRVSAEDDLTHEDATKNFSTTIRAFMDDGLGKFTGGPDARIRVQEKLENLHFNLVNQIGLASAQATEKNIVSELGGAMNVLAMEVSNDPLSFAAKAHEFSSMVDSLPGSPQFKATQKDLATAMFTEATIRKFLQAGAISDVPGMNNDAMDLLDNPMIARALGEERRTRLLSLVQQASKPDDLVEIGDPTSPTGSHFVPKSQAIGKPGRPRTPTVSIVNEGESALAKALGQKDADIVSQVDRSAGDAITAKADITVMRDAINSGKFIPGAFGPTLQVIARFGERLGISEQIKPLVGDAATADTIEAASKRLGLALADKMSKVTNMSLTFIQDSLPSLMRTPAGNLVILDLMERVTDRDMQIAAIADEMTQGEHPSLRPKDKPSFGQRVRNLEKADPLVAPELRERILSESAKAPKSWKDVLQEQAAPSGYVPPPGHTFLRMEGGRAVIRNDATGETFKAKP